MSIARTRSLSRRFFAPCELESLEQRQLLASTLGLDDAYENNDLPSQVAQAPQGATNSPNLGVLTGERIIRQLAQVDGVDYYRFKTNFAAGPNDFVRLNFGNANGNLDLYLLGPGGGNVLGTSLGNTGTETISLNGRAAGTYFVKVVGKNNQTNAVYRLTFQTPSVAPLPPDDVYEDNDTINAVKTRALNSQTSPSPNLGYIAAGTLQNLRLNDTYDIYSFSAASTLGSNAFVRVNSTTPMDMVVYNAAGQAIRSSEAYLGVFRISLAGFVAGRYYVQVTHYALGSEGSFAYSLTFGT